MERHIFDENQPQGSMSLMNLRNALRGLFQGDLMPLRPRATMVLDDMEYPTDALAQAAWAGTGVTVAKSTTKYEGNYALSLVIDATGNRQCAQTKSLDLSAFKYVKIWERCASASQTYRFYVRDSSGNESYWEFTTNGTVDTWQQDAADLTTPTGNNGTNATLSDITSFGFQALPASKTFIFDTVKAYCGMNVAISPALIGAFYSPIYIGSSHLSFAGGSSPALTAPSANPRISLLTINSSGTLEWTHGSEASSPSEPTYPTGKMPICLVYCKTTMAKVVDYEDKDANPNEGYIYKDVRPLMLLGMSTFLSLTDCPSSFSGEGLKAVRVNSGASALEFFTQTLLLLSDTPSSYSGKSKKPVRVNSGETAVEFVDIDKILDADSDTGVEVEQSADEDKVRIKSGGTQRALIDSNGLKLTTGADVNEISTDGTLGDNSDDAIPTEKAVKTYADTKFGSSKVYDSGWFAVSTNNRYTKTHNLGTTKVIAKIYLSENNDGSGWCMDTSSPSGSMPGSNESTSMSMLTTTQIRISTGQNLLSRFNDEDGVETAPTSGYARIIMLALE